MHQTSPLVAGGLSARQPVASLPARLRVESVDILRGIVILLMALDHVREYVGIVRGLDAPLTSWPYFFTRWATHFCAPTFFFLAGTSAWLSLGGRRTTRQLSAFLVTRGLWLIVAEVTIVSFGWCFNLRYPWESGCGLQVIWALGASMIVLAALVWLPIGLTACLGFLLVTSHNLLDVVQPHDLGAWSNLWYVLHVQGMIHVGAFNLFIAYPLIPWIGVMALGYAFGAVFTLPRDDRRDAMLQLGLAIGLMFIIARAVNEYGDPHPWSPQPTALATVLSFLNTSKYPPSLSYLLMTLGPAIAALGCLERVDGPVSRAFAAFGRVPFFFYVVHIYVIHALSVGTGWLQGFSFAAMLDGFFSLPAGFGVPLGGVYAIWVAVVVSLYPLCRWFAEVKARSRSAWLSYL
jgi:uncharacterized membrane protein